MAARPLTILAIMAHPGDAGVLCAGTLAKFRKQGAKLHVACVTDGAAGNKFMQISRQKLASMRLGHEKKAAAVIGATLHWMGFADGSLFAEQGMAMAIVDLVRQVKPDIIITHNPDDFHPDNRAVAFKVFEAAQVALMNNIQTEHEPIDFIPALFYTDSWVSRNFAPTDYVDITEFFTAKRKAVQANKIGIRWLRDFDKISIFELIEISARSRGLQSGCKFAECFRSDPRWPVAPARRMLP